MTEAEKDAVLAAMVRERRELRLTATCLCEKLEKAAAALQMASGIADRGASGLDNAQTAAFETVEYPSAPGLRSMVADLEAARERIRIIDERLDSGARAG